MPKHRAEADSNIASSSDDLRSMFPRRNVVIKKPQRESRTDETSKELNGSSEATNTRLDNEHTNQEIVKSDGEVTINSPASHEEQYSRAEVSTFNKNLDVKDQEFTPTYSHTTRPIPQAGKRENKKEIPNEISEEKKMEIITLRAESLVKEQVEHIADLIDDYCKKIHKKRRKSNNSVVLRASFDLFNLIVSDEDLNIAIRDYWDGESPVEFAVIQQQRDKLKKLGITMRY